VKTLMIIIGVFVLLLLLFVAPFIVPSSTKESSKALVTTSIFPLYDICKQIAKERVDVMMLIPFGVDIHTFEPSPKERIALQKSRLFIYSGTHLEPWTRGLEGNNSIDISRYVKLRTLSDDDNCSDHHHHDHEQHHYDPHYWLDIDNMIIAARVITEKLSVLDPPSQAYFESNLKTYIATLEKLKQAYKATLSTCKKDFIIVNHNAFGYLGSEYHFHIASLSGFSTDALPSAKSMKTLIDTVKEHHVNVVFFEPFSSERLMQTVANESHTKVAVLHPLANITRAEVAAQKSYNDIMRENLQKLSQALECE